MDYEWKEESGVENKGGNIMLEDVTRFTELLKERIWEIRNGFNVGRNA